MDMVLAKSNFAIASRYAELVNDADLRHMVFNRITTEWQAPVDALLTITVRGDFVEGNPLLARSIRNRFPYLDPLNHVQVELLKRHRTSVPGGARGGDLPDDQRYRGGVAEQRVRGRALLPQPLAIWNADVPAESETISI